MVTTPARLSSALTELPHRCLMSVSAAAAAAAAHIPPILITKEGSWQQQAAGTVR